MEFSLKVIRQFAKIGLIMMALFFTFNLTAPSFAQAKKHHVAKHLPKKKHKKKKRHVASVKKKKKKKKKSGSKKKHKKKKNKKKKHDSL